MRERRRAVVTGGTRGIGRAVVQRLVALGYFVEFTYVRSAELAGELEGELSGRCRGTRVDSAQPLDVDAYLKRLLAGGTPISVLINNAGITRDALVKDARWSDVEQTMRVNFGGAFHFSRALLAHMMQQRYGDIVMISSLASANPRPGNFAYAASKAAIERLAASMALEAARFGVAVNTIAPGYVETDLVAAQLDAERRRALLREIPTKRFTSTDEVADAVAFLLARKPMLVGVTLPIGGGGQLR